MTESTESTNSPQATSDSSQINSDSPQATLANLRCVFFDVDGVLTDGRMFFADGGAQMRAFNAHDGLGISRLLRAGVSVVWVSSARADCVSVRGRMLGVRRIFQGVRDKLEIVRKILDEDELPPEAAAFIGDDLPDLPAMRHVGFAIAVPQAVAEVREAAHWVTEAPGGNGAVRELCEKILTAKMAENELSLNPDDGTPNSIKDERPRHHGKDGDRPFPPRDGGGRPPFRNRPPMRDGNRPPMRDGNRPPPGNRRFGRDDGNSNRFSRDGGDGNRFSRDGGGGGGDGGRRFGRGESDGNRRFPDKDGNRPQRPFHKKEQRPRPQDDWRE